MTANWSGRVAVEHLGAEGVLLDLGGTYLVSDHPKHFGGSGRGPTPGELLKGALSTSAALAIGAAQDRGELPGAGVRVRCGFELGREPLEGPLAQLTFLSGFVLDVEIMGQVGGDEARRAEQWARGCRVARALAEDLSVQETNYFQSGAARGARDSVAFIVDRSGRLADDPAELNRSLTPASEAQYLGAGRALATWGASSLIVSQATGAIAPEDLLLAAFATCTTVFAARAAHHSGAKAAIRVTCEGRFDGAAECFGSLDRRLEVDGDLNPEQRSVVEFCADHCNIGQTLRRRARLTIDVRSGEAGRLLSSAGEAAACDDGACCVPELDQYDKVTEA